MARGFDWLAPSPAAHPGDWSGLSDHEQSAVELLEEFGIASVWTESTQILDREILMLNGGTARSLRRKGWVRLGAEQVEDNWWITTAVLAEPDGRTDAD